jgi:hypothetical protein
MNQKNSNISKGDQETGLNLEGSESNNNITNSAQGTNAVNMEMKIELDGEPSVQVVDQQNSV